jgi:hypothetical protein
MRSGVQSSLAAPDFLNKINNLVDLIQAENPLGEFSLNSHGLNKIAFTNAKVMATHKTPARSMGVALHS